MTPSEIAELVQPVVPAEKFKARVWQERDLNFLAPMPSSANWSQMGCFKTSTALWLMQRKKVKNAMIITSKVGKGSYFSDFYKCLPTSWKLFNLNIHDITLRVNDYEEKMDMEDVLDTIKTGFHNTPMVILAHYDVFTTAANNSSRKRAEGGPGLLDKLRKINWDMILIDECHRMKNPNAQWTTNIKKFKAKNRHVMSGTAFVNNPAEIWSILNFLDPIKWSSYWQFRGHFCDEYVAPNGYRVMRGIKQGRVNEFRDLRKLLGPRHTMAEVHRGITKPIDTAHEVDLNPTQRRMFNEIKSTLSTLDQKGDSLTSPNVLSQLNRLRQITVATPDVKSSAYNSQQNRLVTEVKLIEPSSKLDVVMGILDELDSPEEKVVVFSNFRDPLDILKARLEKKKIGFVHLEQKHNENERYRLWHDEFRKPEKKVFLSTLSLGGESINLTCAQYLIFLDRSWSPKDMLQAIGRVYRPGQEGAVEVIHINAKNTTDAYVTSRLVIKEKWFNEIFGD
jgi:SNF2 family DNA or RNA helicase